MTFEQTFALPHQMEGTKTLLSDKWEPCRDENVCAWKKDFIGAVRHWHAVQFTSIPSPIPQEQGEYPRQPITQVWWLILYEDENFQFRLTSDSIPV